MSSFSKQLTVTKVGRRTWKVARAFTYFISDNLQGDYVLVQKFFETDFASIPRIFWAILPPDGKYTQSAVLHDFLYFQKERPRKECDKIFYQAMGVLKVSKWKKIIIYRAVRMFGGLVWKKKKVRV